MQQEVSVGSSKFLALKPGDSDDAHRVTVYVLERPDALFTFLEKKVCKKTPRRDASPEEFEQMKQNGWKVISCNANPV